MNLMLCLHCTTHSTPGLPRVPASGPHGPVCAPWRGFLALPCSTPCSGKDRAGPPLMLTPGWIYGTHLLTPHLLPAGPLCMEPPSPSDLNLTGKQGPHGPSNRLHESRTLYNATETGKLATKRCTTPMLSHGRVTWLTPHVPSS